MFKQAERLTRPLFLEYFKSGKRISTATLQIVYKEHKKLHVAVVVGKKVHKKAHERNKIKRRVYGKLYRELKKGQKTGVYICVVKPAFKEMSAKNQIEEVQKILNRITMSST